MNTMELVVPAAPLAQSKFLIELKKPPRPSEEKVPDVEEKQEKVEEEFEVKEPNLLVEQKPAIEVEVVEEDEDHDDSDEGPEDTGIRTYGDDPYPFPLPGFLPPSLRSIFPDITRMFNLRRLGGPKINQMIIVRHQSPEYLVNEEEKPMPEPEEEKEKDPMESVALPDGMKAALEELKNRDPLRPPLTHNPMMKQPRFMKLDYQSPHQPRASFLDGFGFRDVKGQGFVLGALFVLSLVGLLALAVACSLCLLRHVRFFRDQVMRRSASSHAAQRTPPPAEGGSDLSIEKKKSPA